MHVGVLHIEILIPHATNLKAKRQVLNSIKMGLRGKVNVSVAEVDFQNKWQRAALGFACVGSSHTSVDTTLQHVFSLIDTRTDCELVSHLFEFF